MITFQEYLTEIFDSKIDYTLENSDEWGSDYSFNIDYDEYMVQIAFSNKLGSFIPDKTSIIISFSKNEKYSQSFAEGKEYQVFSTVFNILKDYLKKHKEITTLKFSAKTNDKSRVKLYDAFIKKFASGIGFKLDNTEIESDEKFYVLIKD